MEPVKRKSHNFTYRGPRSDILDLSCERRVGVVFSHWKPSVEELEVLAGGGVVELGVHHEPIPPLSMVVVPAEEPSQPEGQASDAG